MENKQSSLWGLNNNCLLSVKFWAILTVRTKPLIPDQLHHGQGVSKEHLMPISNDDTAVQLCLYEDNQALPYTLHNHSSLGLFFPWVVTLNQSLSGEQWTLPSVHFPCQLEIPFVPPLYLIVCTLQWNTFSSSLSSSLFSSLSSPCSMLSPAAQLKPAQAV